MSNMENKVMDIATIPLRGMVAFSKSVITFDVGREQSVNAVNYSLKNQAPIFLVTQKDTLTVNPELSDLYLIGVFGIVKQVIKMGEYVYRVLFSADKRAKLVNITESKEYLISTIEVMDYNMEDIDQHSLEASLRNVKSIFSEYNPKVNNLSVESTIKIMQSEDPHFIISSIMSILYIDFKKKQKLLEIDNILDALEYLSVLLLQELKILNIEKQLESKVKEQISINQREYFLRQQMKIIKEELGEDLDFDNQVDEFRDRLSKIDIDEKFINKLEKEIDKLDKLPSTSQEASVVSFYLENVLYLPFNESTKDNTNLKNSEKILNNSHYGLQKVKDRILEYVAIRNLTENKNSSIICLCGPPGVGKTSIAKSIAKSLKKQFCRISLGGVSDEAEIRGHRRTYIGSMPGKIIKAIQKTECNNPVILLDEIDKMNSNLRGDPAAALLEILDPEQNKNFEDNYIEIPFDLSKVFFVATANNVNEIPAPLRDRMDIIFIDSYTREEKFFIAKKFLIKKQLHENGLIDNKNIKINDKAIYYIIDNYTKEAGVRNLERSFSKIFRKIAKQIVFDEQVKFNITPNNLKEFLGSEKFNRESVILEDKIGVCNGLAYTSVGGELLPIEVNVLSGTGKIQMTGHLGEVMKESVKIAISYVRSIADKFEISEEFYKTKDIHIHFPDGAIPKDGPSAGIAICTAIFSALTNRYINAFVAMTGEITLRGNVRKIGGLKEKAMGAYKEGIKKVLIPYDNISDLDEVDLIVKDNIEFIPVKTFDDVMNHALKTIECFVHC